MIKVVTIIGARPQFIKAAAVNRVIKSRYRGKIHEILLHTGQHYDENMSQVFFDELGLDEPVYNLNVGSDTHGRQIGQMMQEIEKVLLGEKPDWVLVYGDTNSTLAGSLVASRLFIPVAHVEAGMRSFNKTMPEETNRIICDHVSTLLFSPTMTGVQNLLREGFGEHAVPPYSPDNPAVFHCGDVMYDNCLYLAEIAENRSSILDMLGIKRGNYALATIHRDSNTDIPERIEGIFGALQELAHDQMKVVIPLHPRTSKVLHQNLSARLYSELKKDANILITPPASYFDMMKLTMHCSMVITDSGGMQKEAFFYHKPCIILRTETEWLEIVRNGTAVVAGFEKERIIRAFTELSRQKKFSFPPLFGDGHASEFICDKLLEVSDQGKVAGR
jgi:UDP-GlcNAc3NAcA epimerase